MGQFVVRVRVTEILHIMRDKGEPASRRGFGPHCVRVDLDENGVIDAVALPVKGSALVDGALSCTQFYSVGNLDDRGVRKKLLDPADRIRGRLAPGGKAMVYVIELAQYDVLFTWIAKFLHSLLYALQCARQTAAAFLDDPRFVAGKFIDYRAR